MPRMPAIYAVESVIGLLRCSDFLFLSTPIRVNTRRETMIILPSFHLILNGINSHFHFDGKIRSRARLAADVHNVE
jgi:hypothetical protein